MKSKITILMAFVFALCVNQSFAQVNLDFEPAGTGAGYNWTVDQNGSNPPLAFIANPDMNINTSATVVQFTAEQGGQNFALCFTDDMGTVTFDATNAIVKLMVWKPVISNIEIKFENPGGSAFPVTVANTVTNQWEELTFDFSSQIGQSFTRLVIVPDFAARTQNNTLYFDNLTFGTGGPVVAADSVDITFAVNAGDVTTDAAGLFLAGGGVFGNPGDNPMTDNGDDIWVITKRMPKGGQFYYTFTNGNCPDYSCKEDLTGQACGDPNNFNDRSVNGAYSDTTIFACFGNCIDNGGCAVNTNPVFTKDALFEIAPTLVNDFALINFKEEVADVDKQLQVVNAVGQIVMNETIGQAQQYRLDASQLSNGLYFVVIQSDGFAQTARILVSK